jgi:hypothetical protein
MDRLQNYFFHAQTFIADTNQLKAENAQTFRAFQAFNPDDLESVTSGRMTQELQRDRMLYDIAVIQDELAAHIAGFMLNGKALNMTDEIKNEITTTMVFGLTGFKKDCDTYADNFAERDLSGQWIASPQKIDAHLQELSYITGQHLLGNDRTNFLQSSQKVIDYFYNPGGAGNHAYHALKDGIGNCIDSFSQYAAFTHDPTQALIELSLLPISHWEVYVKRKLSQAT